MDYDCNFENPRKTFNPDDIDYIQKQIEEVQIIEE
jgi:hypothetical protein